MSIKRRELLVLVDTINIVYISSIYVIINIADFKERTEALVSMLLYPMNRRVSNR